MLQIKIRQAEIGDLADIISILNEAISVDYATGFRTPQKTEERVIWFNEHVSDEYPIYVALVDKKVSGWLSVSPYRTGREIFRFTKEISYYISKKHFRMGIATLLLQYAIENTGKMKVKTFLAIVREVNQPSINLLEKLNFLKWGFLPSIANSEGIESGLFYYGLRINP